jgi:GAF domain
VTTTDAGLSSLVTQLGRARASAMDVPAVLGSICSAIPGVLGVGGALLLLVDPPEGVRALTASDTRAAWMGETQQRTNMGPLAGALRTWRPMLTTDLSHIGPPAVAGAAAEYGLGSSLVLPFDVDGDRVGVLQLLGEIQRPVEAAHAEMLRPLLDVLGARLADVRALRRVGRPADVAPQPARAGAAPDPTPPTGRISPPAPNAAVSGTNGATRPPASDGTPPRRGRRQAPPLVPAPRATPTGKDVIDALSADPTAARRLRRGAAHAAPEAASPSESTTGVLPTIPPRSGTPVTPEPTPPATPRAPHPQPRTGRHSV